LRLAAVDVLNAAAAQYGARSIPWQYPGKPWVFRGTGLEPARI